ncbi:hypothetical protein Tco_0785846, partial [Tanacetum coccineum]
MIRMLIRTCEKRPWNTSLKVVKLKHVRPEEAYERVLWGDMKVMFKPDVESDVWRNLQGYNVTIWKLFSSSRVHFVSFQNLHIFMLCTCFPTKAAWKAEYKIHSDVACLMLGKMSHALQRQFELYFPQAMLNELRKMFEKPQAVEIYDLVDTLHSCKQAPGKSVSAHVLEMKGYMDQLQALGKPYDNDMSINLINRSLNKDFVDFVRNFNMHCVGKTLSELHALLIDYEKGLKDKAPTPQ